MAMIQQPRPSQAGPNSPIASASRRKSAAIARDLGAPAPPMPADPSRIGVVFVHGIGTQPACETFLDWSGPIASLLRDWRVQHDITPSDPVVRCQYDLTGATLPFLELDVPEWDDHPAQTLVLTEAWWAATTRAPAWAR